MYVICTFVESLCVLEPLRLCVFGSLRLRRDSESGSDSGSGSGSGSDGDRCGAGALTS